MVTDVEMVRLCADAMGYDILRATGELPFVVHDGIHEQYDPFHDYAQTMDLVRKFGYLVWQHGMGRSDPVRHIVEKVARYRLEESCVRCGKRFGEPGGMPDGKWVTLTNCGCVYAGELS